MSGYKNKLWNYVEENITFNQNIQEYGRKVVR
jgi:hypothetical protein